MNVSLEYLFCIDLKVRVSLEPFTTFSVFSKRYQQFLCSPPYKREIEALEPACVPNQVKKKHFFMAMQRLLYETQKNGCIK